MRWVSAVIDPIRDPIGPFVDAEDGCSEGWCLPCCEAMACGCAVATTDSGGVRDYALDGQTALLSPPRLPELLAQNIIALAKDETMRIRVATSGFDYVRRYSWDSSVDMLESVLLGKVESCA